jgi:phage terminase small subunit
MTPKQRAFAQNYAVNPNAYQSAKDAGYAESFAIGKAAERLLRNPEIITEIKRIRQRMNQTADKSATDVVNEFSKIAFTDRVAFLKPDPLRDGEFVYKSPDELTDQQRAIVEKVTWNNIEIIIIVGEGKDKEVTSHWRHEYNYILSDKAKALENMGRHFGIFDDKLRLSSSQANPFTNVSQAQLEQLKRSWVETMSDQKLLAVDGEFTEVKKNGSG